MKPINSNPSKYEAILSLVGGQLAQIASGEIVYIDGQTPPSDSAIDTKLAEMQAEYDAQEYARKRQVEYPSMGDQMDMIYKDMKNGTSTHADAVEVVKTKYPKG